MEFFLGTALKDEVMKIMPVQKQTRAGQRTRFKVRRVDKEPVWVTGSWPAPSAYPGCPVSSWVLWFVA